MSSLTVATETFLTEVGSWLTDEDAPAVASLRLMAKTLDTEATPALLGQYGLTYRSLLKRKPAIVTEPDALEQLLTRGDDD